MTPYQPNPKPFFLECDVDAYNREGTPVTSIREFTNEFGHKIKIFAKEMVDNHIKIIIEGPNSISENIVTPREFDQLRSALFDYNITSNLTRVDLMDSDYARDVMKIEPTKAPIHSRPLTKDEALLHQEVVALLARLRGPIFGTPTAERAADVIEKLQTALRTLADQKLSSEMDSHEYINAAFEEAYDNLIELARAVCPAGQTDSDYARAIPPLELSEIHIRLLKRGSTSKWIGLSDNAGIHLGEVCALGELERAGFVCVTKDKLPPGPPSMKPYEITEAGRAALTLFDSAPCRESRGTYK
ncbi:hypothetical protein EN780_03360 [Mesorhizobium sp. M4B.F.Ca.ET.089.01.1.1]|uniref:hypothetical protein n=1 Tax=Mesorhizobium sp. M4B.F.Ca.ET.089.01.1.1 TaxID=2496662 RepID=UPI000FE40151|nr:hypothetical protein [Mesorhizobium sp. M4B.F.Ca.ET.089.01.1.1]RWX70446.1 hypothetical protein EN780_03360 [Mesorhizobium sp. M4B.F.Ca.ET.089.01.1.1]